MLLCFHIGDVRPFHAADHRAHGNKETGDFIQLSGQEDGAVMNELFLLPGLGIQEYDNIPVRPEYCPLHL